MFNHFSHELRLQKNTKLLHVEFRSFIYSHTAIETRAYKNRICFLYLCGQDVGKINLHSHIQLGTDISSYTIK